MAGRQVLALVILVRIQVPEPEESLDTRSRLSSEFGAAIQSSPRVAVATVPAPRSLRIQVPEPKQKIQLSVEFFCFYLGIRKESYPRAAVPEPRSFLRPKHVRLWRIIFKLLFTGPLYY